MADKHTPNVPELALGPRIEYQPTGGSAAGGWGAAGAGPDRMLRAVFTRPPMRRSGSLLGMIPPGNRDGSSAGAAATAGRGEGPLAGAAPDAGAGATAAAAAGACTG
ncbi:MAG: hypothetical protein K2W85_12985, partial [Phycisphaerales bacterium]|nr:hypothetical protein [Phycisphaerales bacterium]